MSICYEKKINEFGVLSEKEVYCAFPYPVVSCPCGESAVFGTVCAPAIRSETDRLTQGG